jgi:hypothetical protein
MSARQLPDEMWEIQLAFPGKTVNHWRSVAVFEGTHREAEQEAERLFNEDPKAVDMMVFSVEVAETGGIHV